MTINVGPLENPRNEIECSHTRCDGRPARWDFPSTANRPKGRIRSCSVHVPRFLEILLKEAQHTELAVHSHGGSHDAAA